jgi:hypothetical protein
MELAVRGTDLDVLHGKIYSSLISEVVVGTVGNKYKNNYPE